MHDDADFEHPDTGRNGSRSPRRSGYSRYNSASAAGSAGAASGAGAAPSSEGGRNRQRGADDAASLAIWDGPAAAGGASAQYSRVRSGGRYQRIARSHIRKKSITRRVCITLGAAAGVGVITAGVWSVSFINSIASRLNKGVDDATRAALSSQKEEARQRAASQLSESTTTLPDNWADTTPFYMLLLGTDKSESRTDGDESYLYGSDDSNFRSDVIILTRIDPGNKIVTLVSIHRDTEIYYAGAYRKINAVYPMGGVSEVINVVSQFAGVPITHFAEVDIDGLAAVTNAMGGVWVDVPYTIDDPYMGYLEAGYQRLNGDQAMTLVRSRHAFDYIGDGDRYRAAHQRLFLSAMLKQLLSSPVQTMISVIDTIANYITTDLTLDQILSLAMTMRDMDLENGVYSTMNPTTATYTNNTWYELSDDAAWAELMAIVDAGGKPPVDSAYLAPVDDINSAEDGSNYTTNTVAENDTENPL